MESVCEDKRLELYLNDRRLKVQKLASGDQPVQGQAYLCAFVGYSSGINSVRLASIAHLHNRRTDHVNHERVEEWDVYTVGIDGKPQNQKSIGRVTLDFYPKEKEWCLKYCDLVPCGGISPEDLTLSGSPFMQAQKFFQLHHRWGQWKPRQLRRSETAMKSRPYLVGNSKNQCAKLTRRVASPDSSSCETWCLYDNSDAFGLASLRINRSRTSIAIEEAQGEPAHLFTLKQSLKNSGQLRE